jgi:methyltransferase (TIGR00027 family)
MTGGTASRTAVLVCQGRAAGAALAPTAVFDDSVAGRLLTEDERVPVRQVLDGAPPPGWSERITYESVRASAEVMVPRTVEIDAALLARPGPQLVVLGAGLDDRAWRLPELAEVDVYEVDHRESQRDKQARAADLTPTCRSLRYVTVDFARDRLDVALAAAGHDADVPTSWVWEGVVPYLTEPDVTTTLAAVVALSAPGSRLVVNYQEPSVRAAVGRLAAQAMRRLAGQPDLWGAEPRRSSWTPSTMGALLAGHGLHVVSDVDLVTVAHRLSVPVTHVRSLRSGRVAVADRGT